MGIGSRQEAGGRMKQGRALSDALAGLRVSCGHFIIVHSGAALANQR